MNKIGLRTGICAIFLLSLACSMAVLAQTSILPRSEPDSYVRGTGLVTVSSMLDIVPNQAMFRIDVAKSGAEARGIFQWNELRPNGARIAAVLTKLIRSADFTGNTVSIAAEGFLNGKPAKITIYALEDLAGDFLSVEATTADATYKREGGVRKGELIIWNRPVVTEAAKGFGAIRVTLPVSTATSILPQGNIGQFNFSAVNNSLGAMGSISYREFNPMVMSPINIPRIAINVPKISSLHVERNTALLTGDGMLNGKPVRVFVKAIDNRPANYVLPPIGSDALVLMPDWFSITAVNPLVDSLLPVYHAEGAVLPGGDIVVRSSDVTATN